MQTKKKQEPEEEITLSGLAKDTLDIFDGDVHEATSSLVQELKEDEDLLQHVVSSAVYEACLSFVSKAHRDQRVKIISSITTSKSRLGEAVAACVKENMEMLMDYPLMRGVKLKDATRPLLIEQAEFHGKIESDARWKRKWFTRIASFMPNDRQKVKNVVSPETVIELYNEAQKS